MLVRCPLLLDFVRVTRGIYFTTTSTSSIYDCVYVCVCTACTSTISHDGRCMCRVWKRELCLLFPLFRLWILDCFVSKFRHFNPLLFFFSARRTPQLLCHAGLAHHRLRGEINTVRQPGPRDQHSQAKSLSARVNQYQVKSLIHLSPRPPHHKSQTTKQGAQGSIPDRQWLNQNQGAVLRTPYSNATHVPQYVAATVQATKKANCIPFVAVCGIRNWTFAHRGRPRLLQGCDPYSGPGGMTNPPLLRFRRHFAFLLRLYRAVI